MVFYVPGEEGMTALEILEEVTKLEEEHAGKPYIMWVCERPRNEQCDYREFEDVQPVAKTPAEFYGYREQEGDDIPF